MRYRDWLPDICAVEGSPHSGQNFGGILWILWIPAAFVAAVQRGAVGLGFAAFGAELSAIHRDAAAGPTSGARTAAFRTELAGVLRAAGTASSR